MRWLRKKYAIIFGCVRNTHHLCGRNQIQSYMSENMYCYKYPHPAVATDSVVFGYDGKQLHILLIERGEGAYKGSWALPGGFIRMDETADEGARRELAEETNVRNVYLEQFHTFTAVDRDPRERVMSIAYFALVRKSDYNIIGGDDAAKADWFPIDKLPPLAFDHAEIVEMAKQKLQDTLRYKPIAFKLLDEKFIMSELQKLYELINEIKYDRRNFQKKMLATGFIEEEGIRQTSMQCRAPGLFSFNEKAYQEAQAEKTSRKYPFDF